MKNLSIPQGRLTPVAARLTYVAGPRAWLQSAARAPWRHLCPPLVLTLAAMLAVPHAFGAATLVSEWKFENNYNDTSGNGNHGTATGSPAFVAGKFGQGVQLASADMIQRLAATNLPLAGNDSWSINLWFNLSNRPASLAYVAGFGPVTWVIEDPAEAGRGRALLAFGGPGNNNIYVWGLGEHVDMGTARPYPTNRWTMMTVTHDGPMNVSRVFLDAALVHECSQTLSNLLPTQQIISLAPASFWNADLAGKFDEFTVWRDELTTNQIRNLFSGSPAGAGFLAPASLPPPLRMTNITALLMPDRVQFSWTNGIGPFQIQCKTDLASGQWDILRTTLGRNATLPKKADTAFYRIADLARPRVTLNVYTDKTLYVPSETIEVTVESNRRGTLIVTVFDPRSSADPILDEVVNLPSAPAQRSFTCTTTNESRYLAVADLIFDPDEAPDTARTECGVRRPELAAVPKEVLRTETPALDVPTIRSNLQHAVLNGVPVPLPLGEQTVMIEGVRPAEPFDVPPGQELPPGLLGAERYTAQLLDTPGSVVALTLGPDAPGGNDLHGMILSNPADDGPQSTVWVEPLRLHDPTASNDVHLVYRGEDLSLPLNNHEVETGHAEEQFSPAGIAPAALSPIPPGIIATNKDVRLLLYGHPASDERTRNRVTTFGSWAALVKMEFTNIQPRASTAYRVTVTSVTASAVTNIATNGYGGLICGQVLNKFIADNPGPANIGGISVLFTDFGAATAIAGTTCGGVAKTGTGSGTRWHCLVRDTSSLAFNTLVLGQEVGHNWDWHNDSFHDSHLCGCISEELGDDNSCTIMRGTYGTCTKPQMTYGRYCKDALRHLAEGILRYH